MLREFAESIALLEATFRLRPLRFVDVRVTATRPTSPVAARYHWAEQPRWLWANIMMHPSGTPP